MKVMFCNMRTWLKSKFEALNKGKLLYASFLTPTMLPLLSVQAFAADTIWTKASEIVTVSVALILMNFSRNGRTVDESREWIKRIVITWAVLNSLGFIMAYVTPFFQGGTWTA